MKDKNSWELGTPSQTSQREKALCSSYTDLTVKVNQLASDYTAL